MLISLQLGQTSNTKGYGLKGGMDDYEDDDKGCSW